MPTLNGPMIVHRVVAQITMRKISEASSPDVAVLEELLLKVPLLSARDAMRKPISPQETIAAPNIDAG